MNGDYAFSPLDPFCLTADEDILKAFTLREEEKNTDGLSERTIGRMAGMDE